MKILKKLINLFTNKRAEKQQEQHISVTESTSETELESVSAVSETELESVSAVSETELESVSAVSETKLEPIVGLVVKEKKLYCKRCGTNIGLYTYGNTLCQPCYDNAIETIKKPMHALYDEIFIYNKTNKLNEKIALNRRLKEIIEVVDDFGLKWELFKQYPSDVLRELDKEYTLFTQYVEEGHTRLTRELKKPLTLKWTNKKPYEEYVVFDLETTGLHPGRGAEIIEIGALKVVNGYVVDTFETLVKPQKKITKKITDITGITNEDVEGKPAMEEALENFHTFVGRLPLVAYNTPFDMSFLHTYSEKFDKKKTDDALAIARKKLKKDKKEGNLFSFKLIDVSDFFSYNLDNAHRALADVYATMYVYEELKEYEYYDPYEGLEDIFDDY